MRVCNVQEEVSEIAQRSFKIFEKPPIEESYDYAEQVRRQIERCLEASAIQDKDIRDETFKACVLALENLIPFDDRDEKMDRELEDTKYKEIVDIRKSFAGIRLFPETCKELGIPNSKEVERVNWNQYFRVIFNKFVELKVTVRRGSYTG